MIQVAVEGVAPCYQQVDRLKRLHGHELSHVPVQMRTA